MKGNCCLLSRLACLPTASAVVVAAAVVEGEALVVTSTLGMVVVMTSLPRTQRMQSQSIAKLVLLPSTCVPVFDVVIGLIL